MSIGVLLLCLLLALNFLWSTGKEHGLLKQGWFVASLLMLSLATIIVIISILVILWH